MIENNQPSLIRLPSPSLKGDMSLEEAIARRRSVREFSPEPITRLQLSQILWAAQGITEAGLSLRATPSAGATYPLEIYVVCGQSSVVGIGEGVYHYDVARHYLVLHRRGDLRLDLARAALAQEFVVEAPVDIVICASFRRTTGGYGSRGERYVHIEVGHAGQDICLQAVALGLATVAVGAFRDEQVRKVLQLGEKYQPLYIMPLGKPA